jgi:acetyl-CoA C-acetyltransferase
MAWDGLTNPYDGKAMGVFGDAVRGKYGFTREDQDAYAANRSSARRPRRPVGAFNGRDRRGHRQARKGDVVVDTDEEPGKCDHRKIPTCARRSRRTARAHGGSSSKISDGAAALVLMSSDCALARG